MEDEERGLVSLVLILTSFIIRLCSLRGDNEEFQILKWRDFPELKLEEQTFENSVSENLNSTDGSPNEIENRYGNGFSFVRQRCPNSDHTT